MHCYRITKYNPEFRDHNGAYKKEDWTAISDIGMTFENKALSPTDYLSTEEAYIEAISFFMDESEASTLEVVLLSKHTPPKKNDVWYSSSLLKTYQLISDNNFYDKHTILNISRLALREYIWCKLKSDKMFVHFGYDYYMYIGSKKKPIHIIPQIEALGLFVEKIDESPYEQTACDEEDGEV